MIINGTQAVCIFNQIGTRQHHGAVVHVSRDLCNLTVTTEGNNSCMFQFQNGEDDCKQRLKKCGLLEWRKQGGPDNAFNITAKFTSQFHGNFCCVLSSSIPECRPIVPRRK